MIVSALQNLAFFVLGGLGLHVIASSQRFGMASLTRQVLTGAVFGAVALLSSLNAFVIPDLQVPFDTRAGSMIAAGFLGGAPGAAIAFMLAAFSRVLLGGQNLLFGLFILAGFTAVGILARALAPAVSWPRFPGRAVGIGIAGFLIVQFLPVIIYPQVIGPRDPEPIIGLQFAAVGILSIIVTSVCCNTAFRLAMDRRMNAMLQRRLHLAATSAGIGFFEWSPTSDFVYFDEGLMALYGFDRPPGLLSRADWWAGVHPDDLAELKRMVRASVKQADPSGRYEFRYGGSDGEWHHIRASWGKEFGADGQLERIVGVHSDITDILQSRARQEKIESQYAMVAANSPGVLMSLEIDRDGATAINFIGPQCAEIWGYSAAEMMDKPHLLDAVGTSGGLAQIVESLRGLTREPKPLVNRFRVKIKSGEERWLDLHGGVTQLGCGNVRLDCILQDVTTEVEAQRELSIQSSVAQQAQKQESIGLLTGGIAHDFNNILAAMLGNLELLRLELKGPDTIEMADAAIAAGRRGAELTKNLLSFSRRASLVPTVLDLNEIVLDTAKWIVRTLPATIEVKTSLQAGLWETELDKASTESALLNLILNARDAMPGGGKMTIETANMDISADYLNARSENLEPGRYVMLAVSDTGHGMDAELVRNIFDPFFSTKMPGKGTGLGLSMVQGFVKQSGGTVRVYSEPGTGTTFKLFFKAEIAAVEAEDVIAIAPEPVEHRSRRILVAEDQPDVLAAIVRTLEAGGHHVVAATSGDQAIDIFEKGPAFDLLLTDIVMPGALQGPGLARAIRVSRPDFPIVFMTGYAGEASVHGNGLHKQDIRLMKPVLRSDLLAAIDLAMNVSDRRPGQV